MMSNLQALTLRRVQLIADIQRERSIVRSTMAVMQQDLAYAGLGLMAGRLVTQHTWQRTITLASLAVAAGRRLATKPKYEK